MKISFYELLGMIKENTQPKKVKYNQIEYVWNDSNYNANDGRFLSDVLDEKNMVNKNIEIEKLLTIPKKLDIKCENLITGNEYLVNEYGVKCFMTKHSRIIAHKLNELIEYLEVTNNDNK